MSPEAHVRTIYVLDELKGALDRFKGEAQEALQTAEREIQRTLEWLAERRAYWRRMVQRCREDVRRAEAELARCRNSGYRDEAGRYHTPDCSAYEHALWLARRRLGAAEAELRNVLRWQRVVEQAAAEYRRQAQRLGAMLQGDLPKATALLDRKSADLYRYVSMASPGSSAVAMVAESPTGEGTYGGERGWRITGSSEEIARLHEALDRLSETEVGAAICESLREHGTTIRFGEIAARALAYFDSEHNEIVLRNELRDASSEILAAHLAHEGIHAQRRRPNSINQEYHAFRAQAEVWERLKGDQEDSQCDTILWMISLGEREAKNHIRRHYPYLPEDA